MTRDPREGVADDGTIVTGADRVRVPALYEPVLRDAVTAIRSALAPDPAGIHVYGSVATGQARPPRSDVDLLVVTAAPRVPQLAAVAGRLSQRHREITREVAVASMTPADLEGDAPAARASRCFLRHYTVHLAGPDHRPAAACRASVTLALGFNGDVAEVTAGVRRALVLAGDGESRHDLVRRGCRKLLLAAATLLGVEEGSWSTDRAAAVGLIGRAAPSLRPLAERALAWCEPDAVMDPAAATEVLDGLGGWVVATYAEAMGGLDHGEG